MDFRDVLYSLDERVASIRFNRPNSPNALTIGMLSEISDANNS
jgi:enoyl-CoA hydratase/carnithine racemase